MEKYGKTLMRLEALSLYIIMSAFAHASDLTASGRELSFLMCSSIATQMLTAPNLQWY